MHKNIINPSPRLFPCISYAFLLFMKNDFISIIIAGIKKLITFHHHTSLPYIVNLFPGNKDFNSNNYRVFGKYCRLEGWDIFLELRYSTKSAAIRRKDKCCDLARFIAELLDYFVQSWQLSFHNYPSLAALWIAHATTQTTSTCVLQEHGCNTDPFFGMSRFYRISWLQKYFSTFQSGNIFRMPRII